MSGRQSHAVTLAVRLVRERGYTAAAAAAKHGVAVSSVRRALLRAGVPPNPRGRPRKAGCADSETTKERA